MSMSRGVRTPLARLRCDLVKDDAAERALAEAGADEVPGYRFALAVGVGGEKTCVASGRASLMSLTVFDFFARDDVLQRSRRPGVPASCDQSRMWPMDA
jgi:hypothetical protein